MMETHCSIYNYREVTIYDLCYCVILENAGNECWLKMGQFDAAHATSSYFLQIYREDISIDAKK